ncbi:hypothetical protein SNK03_13557 [Fusarium graminearum]|uniref:Chromosome 1, complete genome n=2 Tax=Gibberella zeae TaxID=5518 RepID=I1S4Q0_GIBZE|nr:hypothetical protein FGSG_11818 [Fusarium graminearum PH-1]CAF3514660.1 unnamed protein product [Fusarium graminearum]ESU05951.1 hypothetical protein FGSG_11818 [Fusarium graminearum PH-1]CAG2005023.1 unnamed protein product [Fusarium graminearum]CEF72723.1 unnamed protein product [Fusarium graminearum]CZS75989.1 unnamed protein product [Fusarium graminearum]|eukprot:XP_011316436.1 hypothetical protein FGSG_11818 [Fusarium graminearum PH-1]
MTTTTGAQGSRFFQALGVPPVSRCMTETLQLSCRNRPPSSDRQAAVYFSQSLAIDAESCDIDSINTTSAHASSPGYRTLLEGSLSVFAQYSKPRITAHL